MALGAVLLGHGALAAAPAPAAIAFVQASPSLTTSGATVTATLPSPSTAGTLLVATTMDVNSNCATSNFTAPSGWVKGPQVCRGSNGPLIIWYRPDAPSGITSVTFNTGTTGSRSIAQVSEFSGVATTSPLDQSGTYESTAPSTSLSVSTAGSVSMSGELAVTALGSASGLGSLTSENGWTNLALETASGYISDYRLNPASGAVLTETVTSSPQTNWAGAIATFKPAPCSTGSLTLTSAPSLTFPGVTLNGYNRSASAALSVTAADETGTGSGWNLSATSTTFSAGGGLTLPTGATTFSAGSAATATGNCSLPTSNIGYPITLPAGATPPAAVSLFNATSGTGKGPAALALTANVAIPANAGAGSYSSTWTLTLSSGP